MIEKLKDFFFECHLRVMLILGLICVATVFAIDFRGIQAVITLLISLGFAFLGQKLAVGDTSENWLKISYGPIIKSVIGSVFMMWGWAIFLRGVFALAIASVILKMS